MLTKLPTAFGAGLAAHQLRPYLKQLPEGPRELLSYTIGSLLVFVMTIFVHDDERSWPLSHALALGAVGAGVVTGWIKDAFQAQDVTP